MNCIDSVEIFCDCELQVPGILKPNRSSAESLPSQRHPVLPRWLWFPYYCLKDVLSHLTSITVSYLVSISQLDKLLGNQVTRASPSPFTSTFHLLTFSTKKHFAFSLHLIPFYFTHSFCRVQFPLLAQMAASHGAPCDPLALGSFCCPFRVYWALEGGTIDVVFRVL